MNKELTDLAKQLKDSNKKVQLIYAFNGSGKTRLSRAFKDFLTADIESDEVDGPSELSKKNVLYYNAFTEDLFYWDNDLLNDETRVLKIHPNAFTDWVFKEQG
ncbi:MAG: anticodon nuclease, partial [Paraglaciecola chathamensis]